MGNINFILGLIKNKILSKKVVSSCLINLYDRYQKEQSNKEMKELSIEGLILFTEKFGRIVYELDKEIKPEDKEEYQLTIDDIFKKLEKIKEEKDLPSNIKNNIINLEEKRKNNYLDIKEQLSQNDINLRIKNELKDYKDSSKTEEDEEEKEIWKETTFIINKRITYGKAFGNILEGFFVNAVEIMKEEENPKYLKNYLYELIDYYYDSFSKDDINVLKIRLINLFSDLIINIGLDIPDIYDLYAYTLNLFMEYDLIGFEDLSELDKIDTNIEYLVNIFKNLKKYYQDDKDFKVKLKKLLFVKKNEEKFDWVFK